ncbi:MAG: ATP-dependent DNA helicase RecG [Chloroflexota bacterium]
MQPSLEKLRKFFRLEHENGYANIAVIGGLAKILDFWEGEARIEGIPEEIIQSLATTLHRYGDLTSEARADALIGLWKQIQDKIPEANTTPDPKLGIPSQSRPKPERRERKPEQEKHTSRETKRPGRAEKQPGGQTSKTPIALNASLQVLSGVGPRNAKSLASLGMNTLGDMLYYFPRRYDDYSQLKPIHRLWYGDEVTVIGNVQTVHSRKIKGGALSITEAVINDGTGGLRLTWFNQPWVANRLKEGEAISVSGKIEQYLGRLVMNNPDWETIDVENLHTNRIVPIYPLTANITQKWLRKIINQVVVYWAPKLTDHLPEEIRRKAELPDLGTALLQVHYPDSQEQLNAVRQRLAFDEIFFLQMGVLRQKRDWQATAGRAFSVDDQWFEARLSALPFPLTNAQKHAVDDIRKDLISGHQMNRLLQGDVGSGKTVVAAMGAAIVASHGSQAAIMAPTSILAEQHYRNFIDLLAGENGLFSPEEICLLIGDTPENEKEIIRTGLSEGQVKIVIGTHALLEDPVQFADLQYVVVDEQHRFGVEQRALLRGKGTTPHLLVMTATPIPRSLALTLYGDLDLSVMDEMPPGRQSIETYVLTNKERERAYTLLEGQVTQGYQGFIVYPLIEESEKLDVRSAVEEHARLQQDVFPNLRLGLLHGRMRPEEKDAVMMQFRDGHYEILVSTTVVEVGVDVPNATVMLVEGANRFGLAQLHQLRGRVGRGEAQSYCLLIPDQDDAAENERLTAMVETNDGFILAERDLHQRGPGEFLGTRQSGFASSLRMANLTDIGLIEKARLHAQELFTSDPNLSDPENLLLAEALERFWGGGKGDVS